MKCNKIEELSLKKVLNMNQQQNMLPRRIEERRRRPSSGAPTNSDNLARGPLELCAKLAILVNIVDVL